jgi:hypothetical protein
LLLLSQRKKDIASLEATQVMEMLMEHLFILGFKPAFVMIKRTDSTGSWPIEDSARRNAVIVVCKYYIQI